MRAMVLGLILLSGCVGQTMYVMRNPKTGEMAQCQSDPHNEFVAAKIADDCAKAYELAGWERLNK